MIIVDRERPNKDFEKKLNKEINEACSGLRKFTIKNNTGIQFDNHGAPLKSKSCTIQLVAEREDKDEDGNPVMREYMIAKEKRTKEGAVLYYPESFRIELNYNLYPKGKDREYIWFLKNVMQKQSLKRGGMYIFNEDKEAEDANVKDIAQFESGMYIKRELSDEQIFSIAPSWGVVNLDNKSEALVRKQLWDAVSAKANKDKGKSYEEFVRQAKTLGKGSNDEVEVRSAVIKAIDGGLVEFKKVGWHYEGRDGQICYVPPKRNDSKDEVLVEFLLDNKDSKELFLKIVNGVKEETVYSLSDLEKMTIPELDELATEKLIAIPQEKVRKKDKIDYILANL